jgi:cystathionine gamma-synthase
MTHAGMGAAAARPPISDSLPRLSVGLEAEADIIAGLAAGLHAVDADGDH